MIRKKSSPPKEYKVIIEYKKLPPEEEERRTKEIIRIFARALMRQAHQKGSEKSQGNGNDPSTWEQSKGVENRKEKA